jgi:hypothetical protein
MIDLRHVLEFVEVCLSICRLPQRHKMMIILVSILVNSVSRSCQLSSLFTVSSQIFTIIIYGTVHFTSLSLYRYNNVLRIESSSTKSNNAKKIVRHVSPA